MLNNIILQKVRTRESFFSDKFLDSNTQITKNISLIVVTHLIDTGIPYISTLDKYFDLQAIIPKRNSVNQSLLPEFPQEKIIYTNKEEISTSKEILSILENIPTNNKVAFLDIGGYFCELANFAKRKFGSRFIGVIEDTENGYQKYLLQQLTYPVISVARSVLKENEDYLVGQAVVFSAESILREQGLLINAKKIGIIGIGKIGNGILSSLIHKSSQISIFDTDPTKLIIPYSRGAKIDNKLNVVKESDIVFLATGNLSLRGDDYKYLKNGSFIFSVTSSDDEIDISWVNNVYESTQVTKYITKYDRNGHYFFLINNGNAVNFIHGAVVDDFILLVQKEMIDSIIALSNLSLSNQIYNGFEDIQKRIADCWIHKILNINT